MEPLIVPRFSGEWERAARKVEMCLEAHRIRRKLVRDRLTYRILHHSAERLSREPAVDPETAAMEETERVFAALFENIDPDTPSARLLPRGRLALLLGDVLERWPESILHDTPVDEELLSTLQANFINPSPAVQLDSELPQPTDPGPVAGIAGDTRKFLERPALLLMLLLWLVILALLVLLFFWTR